MKRAAAILLALVASAARTARAESPPAPTLGVQVALSGGATLGAPNGPVDHELALAGWPRLPTFVPDAGVRFGLTFHDLTVDLNFSGIDAGLSPPIGSKATGVLHRGVIGVDLGTRAPVGHGIAIDPFLGIGGASTTLCFGGPPSTRSALGRSPFSQVVTNPGQGVCLAATSPVVDVGLAIPWTVLTWRERGRAGDELLQTLTIGPKLAYSLRIEGGRTWSSEPGAGAPISIPKFTGPTAPIGGAYVGIEAQYTFGARFGGAAR